MEVGFVTKVEDFLIHLDGMPTIKIDDVVENEQGVRGWVTGLSTDKVQALLLDDASVKPGELFKRSDKPLKITVGEFLLGRTVNPLGVATDGKGMLSKTKTDPALELDRPAPGIKARSFISNQLETGITVIDTLIPIGKGQRELILGDARSGINNFLVDIIVNQKRSKTICVYASIGKPVVEIRNLIDMLEANHALDYTVIIGTSSTDPAPLIYLAPQAAFSVAEYFQQKGRDVLIILDDLGNHAKISREISLLAEKIPTRESYPADIFYQHAHMLERAGNFKKEAGGGSITALPVVQVNLSDLTSYIPTNIMSMTDGHLLFKSELYNQGQRPAIDISLSVSRVGLQTQKEVVKLLASKFKSLLSQAGELANIGTFSGELSLASQVISKQASFINELLKQDDLVDISSPVQTLLLALVFTQFLTKKDLNFLIVHKYKLIDFLSHDPEITKAIPILFSSVNEEQFVKSLELLTPRIEEALK